MERTIVNMNLLNILQQAAALRTGIVIYPAGRKASPRVLPYSELLASAKSKSKLLLQRFKMSEHIPIALLHFDNHQTTIEWFWACIVAGMVPCMSTPLSHDPEQRKKHLLHLHNVLDNPILLTNQHLLSELLGIDMLNLQPVEELQKDEKEAGRSDTEACRDWKPWWTGALPLSRYWPSLFKAPEQKWPGEAKGSADLAVLMLTSGSTGDAKVVCLRHSQVIKALKGKTEFHRTSKETVFLNWIGMDHVAALTEIHLHAMMLGSDQVHASGTDIILEPIWFMHLLSKHRVGYSFAPNFFLAALSKALSNQSVALTEEHCVNNIDLSHLKALISGGEANQVETCQKLTQQFSEYGNQEEVIRPGFGMTETCAGSIYGSSCPSYDLARGLEFASVGKAIPGMQIRIMNEDGFRIAGSGTGDLQVRGAVVFTGYYGDEIATRKAFTSDGWFITGDRAFVDDTGCLNLAGRAKESIIINGVHHYPHKIESAIEAACIDVIPSYTVAFAHRDPGSPTESVCIVYSPAFDTQDLFRRNQTADVITRICIAICGARPHSIIGLEKHRFAKSSLGKLMRKKIQAAFENGDYHMNEAAVNFSPRKDETRDLTEMESTVKSVFSDVLGFQSSDIGPNTNFYDVGVTSIELLRLKAALQAKLQLTDIPLITILSNPSVETTANCLAKLCQTGRADEGLIYNPVVALSAKGSKPPLWLVHPGVGEVLVFLGLAKHINDRPVYALRARGFEDGERFFESIPEIVEIYCEHIKQRQPHGPYALAGYSFGAMLTFEISKRLEAQSDEVRFCGSFNLPPHIKYRMQQLDGIEVMLNLGCFLGFYDESYVQNASPIMHTRREEEVMNLVLGQAPPSRLDELALTKSKFARWASLAHAMQHAAREYEPKGSILNIDVFYCTPLASVARDRQEWMEGHLSKWTDFSRTRPLYHEVDGAHYTMLDSDNVESFARVLEGALAQRRV